LPIISLQSEIQHHMVASIPKLLSLPSNELDLLFATDEFVDSILGAYLSFPRIPLVSLQRHLELLERMMPMDSERMVYISQFFAKHIHEMKKNEQIGLSFMRLFVRINELDCIPYRALRDFKDSLITLTESPLSLLRSTDLLEAIVCFERLENLQLKTPKVTHFVILSKLVTLIDSPVPGSTLLIFALQNLLNSLYKDEASRMRLVELLANNLTFFGRWKLEGVDGVIKSTLSYAVRHPEVLKALDLR